MHPQIIVLDAGGQYCHLIARKVRDLGVYAEVKPSDTPAAALAGRKGIIISGGPSSVYDPASPTIDPALLRSGIPVLGICYGQQLMAHLLGGRVEKGERGEYGFAQLEIATAGSILKGIQGSQQVWMSHRDTVIVPPEGFETLGSTATCTVAAIADPGRKLFAVQFHPEVVHTPCGPRILSNFVFDISGCERDWDPAGQIQELEAQIRKAAAGRNVFFFVSGGVDSTVAYTLCLKALGPDRVHGTYVDTGLMREGETDFVRANFASLGASSFEVVNAREQFMLALNGLTGPEEKRHAIGEEFVRVQQRILDSEHYLDGQWVLGQGTIYPDTIESGGTAKADLIKTHHNRVQGIQKLIDEGKIVEPLSSFYKDEVRAVGRQLNLPAELLERHPFPGPGLAIRCLCSKTAGAPEKVGDGWLLPVLSVGVQGDSRTYRAAFAVDHFPASQEESAALINALDRANRVVVRIWSSAPISDMRSAPAHLTPERLERLRAADAIVRKRTLDSGFDEKIWQLPVVLIPFGTASKPDSIVLRPIDSVDGMTASVVRMPEALLNQIVAQLQQLPGVAGVFYDVTNKPPGTIEWE
ncbi:MAG: glutamine-hydrolyzing GMP synthase [Acidobacteriota bacterium]